MDIEQLDNSFPSLPGQGSDEIAGALAALEVRDWKNIECVFKKSNCYTNFDLDQLKCLTLATTRTPRKYRLQYVIGQLSAWMHTTASTAKKQEYFYSHHILGEPVCKSVFLEVNGIGDHVYQELKTIAEE